MTDEQKIREDLDELKEEFAELKELSGEFAEDALDEGKDRIRAAKRKFGRRSEELLEELMPIIEKYQDSGRAAVQRVENKVSDNPLLALALAFGAGVLVAKRLDNDRR